MSKAPTSDKITLGTGSDPIRFSFLAIDKPKSFDQNTQAKYQATALLDPSNKAHAATIKQLQDAAADLLKQAGLEREDLLSVCFGNGDKKKYDGYKGMIFLQASNEVRPTLVDRNRNPVAPGDKQFPYSGAHGILTCTLWLQNNKFGKRINANLRALQFVKDGPAFGVAPVNADDEFEALGDGPSSPGVSKGSSASFLD